MRQLKETVLNRISTKYGNHYQFYVDGSVDPDSGRSASAFLCQSMEEETEHAVRVSDLVSSTQAELAAIHQCLLYLQENPSPYSCIVIHCDSEAAIKSLKVHKTYASDQHAHEILAKEHKTRRHLSFILHWVPSHIGIPGNEKVDALVKRALSYAQINISLPPSFGQIKSTIRRHLKRQTASHFKKRAEEVVPTDSHGIQFASYLALNPTLKPQSGLPHPPSVSRTLNRLRLDTESWCYIHTHPTQCSYCQDTFSPSHYLLDCPVTSSSNFREQLTVEEYSLPLHEQAILIMKRLETNPFGTRWVESIQKHPLHVTCAHPEHVTIPNSWIHIPKGL